MKLKMVVMYDSKTEAYGVPNFVVSIGGAIRGFTDEINRDAPDNILHRHPHDFSLYHIGDYDDNTATFELLQQPREIARGIEMAQKEIH